MINTSIRSIDARLPDPTFEREGWESISCSLKYELLTKESAENDVKYLGKIILNIEVVAVR